MINHKKELEQQLSELSVLLTRVNNGLKRYRGLEEGNIRVTASHGIPQYQFVKKGKDIPTFIPAIEKEKISLLVQRDYDRKMQEHLQTMQSRLRRFLNNYNADSIDSLYENLCPGRKQLVTPILPTNEMLIQAWLEKHPGCMNTIDEAPEIKTNRGECVRSKSEKIIADYLFKKGIPYQYEPAFRQHDGRTVYPDFIILNSRLKKTIYWEHLGKVDGDNYATRNFGKLMDYEKSGLLLGDNLIVTLETQNRPLDIELVEKKVQTFLL